MVKNRPDTWMNNISFFCVLLCLSFLSRPLVADDPGEYLRRGIAATQELADWDTHQQMRSNQSRDYSYAHTNLKKSGGGYGRSAHIQIQLYKYNSNADASRDYDRRVRTAKRDDEKRILGEDFGIADRCIMYESFLVVQRDGTPKGRPAYWIFAIQDEWLLRASLYDRLDESFVSDASAKQIIRSLSKNIFDSIKPTSKQLPVIFLPGVAGTQLYVKVADSPRELWPLPYSLTDVKRMLLNEQGIPVDKDVFPKDIIRSKLSGADPFFSQLGVYHNLIEHIQSIEFENGTSYVEDENLFAWGYDWRLDNTAQLSSLDRYVNGVRAKTNSEKVILIAHSMGGLISRAYAVRNPDKVDTIISIGSPYAGSPKPFYGLLMGYTFNNHLVSPDFMKDLLQNAAATYQLLPQYDFVIDTETFEKIPNREVYSKIRYKGTERSGAPAGSNTRSMNKMLLEKAGPFYSIVGTSSNPVALAGDVKHYAIIGIGVQTLEGFVLRPALPKDNYYLEYAGSRVVLDPFFGNGDGTVPLRSANIKNTTRTYFIEHDKGFYSSGLHGSLPNNMVVQSIVESILKGVPFRVTGSPDPATLVDDEPSVDFTLRSDAHLSIKDEATGRMLGYNEEGVIEQALPGTFLVMGETEHASVAGIGKPLAVQVKGIRDGKFSLEITSKTKGRSTSFSFDEVDVQDGTVASFEADPGRITESSLPQMTIRKADQSRILRPSPGVPEVKKDAADIPSLNADIVKFGFFESDRRPPPVGERTFQQTFDTNSTRFVFWHLELEYPALRADTDIEFEAVWYMPDGREMNRQHIHFQRKAGWTRSYYAHGWGSTDGDSYKVLGDYRVELVMDGEVIASGQFTITDGAKQKKPVFDFTLWPMEHKLNVALSRLDRAIRDSCDERQRAGYSRARAFVAQAKGDYLRYRNAEGPLFRGSTDPADCPHGMMKVLRVCEDAVKQIRGGWQISPHSPEMTAAAVQQATSAIEAAEKAMIQAVREVETHRGWITHQGPKGVVIQSPPQFKKFESDNWPLSLRVQNAKGNLDRIVLVTWRAKPRDISEMAFQEKAIAKEKSEHPDFHDLESWQHWSGVSGHWFSYRYTWEGQEIKALIYQNAFGPLPWQLRYVGKVTSFDIEECEEIVRSLTVNR